jgi:L-threonylcarbamoyladenylate synthase
MRLISTTDPSWLEGALSALREGGVVALPTETVYGLAASLRTPAGVSRIFRLKGRTPDKALPLQAASVEQAEAWGFRLGEGARRLARALWPGPLTLILARPEACPPWFAPGSATLGLRIPSHPAALSLLRAWGEPLAVTSANRSEEPECLDGASVASLFADEDDLLVVEAGLVSGGTPSTVVDATGVEPKILREGPIARDRIEEVWHGTG